VSGPRAPWWCARVCPGKSAEQNSTAWSHAAMPWANFGPHSRVSSGLSDNGGCLPSDDLKRLIEEALEAVSGVADMDNQVRVTWPGPSWGD